MDYFDLFKDKGEKYLKELCDNAHEESPVLEFKTSAETRSTKFNKTDKRNLGKELSALSNSAGGTIIWGVSTEKEDGVDRAKALCPVANIENVYSEVQQYTKEYLQPRNDDIEVAMAHSKNSPGSGYLSIRVGRSERRPHMSNAPDDKRYYRRIGDSSYAMEHFDVEDMMSRKQVAWLKLGWEIRSLYDTGTEKSFSLLPRLRNPSPFTSFFPYFEFRNEVGFEMGRDTQPGFEQYKGEGRWVVATPRSGVVINPGQSLPVAGFHFKVSKNTSDNTWWYEPDSHTEKSFDYRFGCQDRQVEEGTFRLSLENVSQSLIRDYNLDMHK